MAVYAIHCYQIVDWFGLVCLLAKRSLPGDPGRDGAANALGLEDGSARVIGGVAESHLACYQSPVGSAAAHTC